MDIRVLQYFLTVAREGSITKAAESLNMTQPPLSRQLKDLEEELVELMEKTKAELTSPEEGIGGDIHIGCEETDAISFLARTARRLQEQYPLIHYHIYSGDSELVRENWIRALLISVSWWEPICPTMIISNCRYRTLGVS